MATKKKKFDGNIIREVQTVNTAGLVDQAAIKFSALTLVEDFRILRTELGATGKNVDDQQPNIAGLAIGICNGELTAGEIAACLTAGGALNANDASRRDEANTWAKILGYASWQVNANPQNTLTFNDVVFLNESGGPIIVSKDRWTYNNPEGWAFFLWNNCGAPIVDTATPQFRLQATHYGMWR